MNETHASSPRVEPFSANQATAAGTDFAELQLTPHGLFWNEYRPTDASCRIWHWQQGQARCLTPAGFSARSRVYEYGGGAFCVSGEHLVFVNDADQQLYRQPLAGGAPEALTQATAATEICKLTPIRFWRWKSAPTSTGWWPSTCTTGVGNCSPPGPTSMPLRP